MFDSSPVAGKDASHRDRDHDGADPSLLVAIQSSFTRHGRCDGLDLSHGNIARAVGEFKQVQLSNQSAYRAAHPGIKTAGEDAWLRHYGTLASPYDKSALLRRLIEGKPALRHPAPTSMSYPAYPFVESDEVFRVSIGFDSTSMSTVVIEQCAYIVAGMNAAARKLHKMLGAGRTEAKSETKFDGNQFLAAVAEKPVWTVRFGDWPAWELTVGTQAAGAGRRDSVERRAGVPHKRDDVLWGGWGPIDVTSVSTTAEDSLAGLRAKADRLPLLRERQSRGERLEIADLAALNWAPMLERDLEIAAHSPRQLDWIAFRQEGWVLRRSAEWNGFTDLYINLGKQEPA